MVELGAEIGDSPRRMANESVLYCKELAKNYNKRRLLSSINSRDTERPRATLAADI